MRRMKRISLPFVTGIADPAFGKPVTPDFSGTGSLMNWTAEGSRIGGLLS